MKILSVALLASILLFGYGYEGSTTSAVTLVGGIIKSTHIEPSETKYKRKDCPVCKGTGKYLSGDGIKMVDCGYCEPDKPKKIAAPITTPSPVEIVHPPIILNEVPRCTGPECQIKPSYPSSPPTYRGRFLRLR